MNTSIGNYANIDFATMWIIVLAFVAFIVIMWWIGEITSEEVDPLDEAECNCHTVGHPCAEHIKRVQSELKEALYKLEKQNENH